MAVYTHVSDAALGAFLEAYDLGAPVAFKGMAEGVENSNYYLETTHGQYFLTLFEKRVNRADLPFFVGLKQHLAAKGFPCPEPVAARDGIALRTLEARPALIVTFLEGLSPRLPNVAQCGELGAALARMHIALSDFTMTRANDLGPQGWARLWKGRAADAERLQPGLARLIEDDLAATQAARAVADDLPRGTIHADLFPDNAFFKGDTFCGAFDFYFACTDALAYDLAVCLNAWAFETPETYSLEKGRALMAGYESVRRLLPAERAALPVLARGAGLRFFLTRLTDWFSTPEGALVKPKNPLEYAARLVFHRRATRIEAYGG